MHPIAICVFLLGSILNLSECVFKKPNILIIMADDLGYGDLGLYGNTTLRTPHIDRLGREGLKMTHHFSAAPECTPSRAAFFTGKYPIRIGMAATNRMRVIPFVACTSGLPPNETTIAELAKQQGYRTALVGKWHLGLHCSNEKDFCHHPLRQGFDYFYGSILTMVKDFGDHGESVMTSYQPNAMRNLAVTVLTAIVAILAAHLMGVLGRRGTVICLTLVCAVGGLVYYIPHGGMKRINSIIHRNLEVVEQPIRFTNLTQRLVWEGIDFMEKSVKEKEPFFLMASWFQVHTPLYNSVPGFAGGSKHGPYGDNVEEMDWSVGQLLAALDRLGVTSDTVVYFVSDNGGHVEETDHLGRRAGGHNAPWRGGKLQAGVEGGARVPGVVRWPGKIPAGSVSDEPTSMMDILPTFAGMMGVKELPKELDGRDLGPLFSAPSKTRSPHTFLFHYCGNNVHAVRWRDTEVVWKVRIASPNWRPGTEGCTYVCSCFDDKDGVTVHGKPLLFNMNEDPRETSPIPADSQVYAKVVPKILEALKRHSTDIQLVPNQYAWHRFMWRPWLQPCCNFPLCNCRDNKWDDYNG